MFLRDSVVPSNVIIANEIAGEEIISHGIPLLSYSEENYVFARTRKIVKILKKFKEQILEKGGVIYQ